MRWGDGRGSGNFSGMANNPAGLGDNRAGMGDNPAGLGAPRRQLLVGAGFCLLGMAAVAAAGEVNAASAQPSGPTKTAAARRAVDRRAVNRVHTRRSAVALTFDDGPDPDFTPAVLDALARFDAKATFFCVGSNAQAHPALVARMLREGHVVANHTQDHLWLDQVRPDRVRSEIVAGSSSLAGVGVRAGMGGAAVFRPPRGWTSPTVASLTRELGLRSIFWSDCVEAHLHGGREAAAARVVANAGPGSIILAHDGGRIVGPNPQQIDRSGTVAAVPHVLEGLRRSGLALVTVPELLHSGRAV